MATIAFKLPSSCRGRFSSELSHMTSKPWPRYPSQSPTPLPIRPPVGLGRGVSIISDQDTAYTESLSSPCFPRMPTMFPSVSTYIVPRSARSFQTHPALTQVALGTSLISNLDMTRTESLNSLCFPMSAMLPSGSWGPTHDYFPNPPCSYSRNQLSSRSITP